MDTVAAQLRGQVGSVVQQEGDVAALADGAQDVDGPADVVVIGRFQAKLDAIDPAGVQRFRQPVGEGRRLEARRRDQVQPAGGGDAQPLPW